MIQVVNYGCGNLGSVANMLRRIGEDPVIVSKSEDLIDEKIILPGVGSFDTGMGNLLSNGWIAALNRLVLERKVPVLGICLGMQLMTNHSEEGKLQGLGWVKGEVIRFPSSGLKVPHMGWNAVTVTRDDKSILTSPTDDDLRFYFVHSYYVQLDRTEDRLGTTIYGTPFTSAFRHDNIFGVQFHPEKSHKFGMNLLKNFASL